MESFPSTIPELLAWRVKREETIAFVRDPGSGRAAAAIPLEHPDLVPILDGMDVPVLVFGWTADEPRARAKLATVARPVELLLCPHPDGAPACWCRPPLPGLWLAFARKYAVDARASTMFATSPAHRTMAAELGMRVG